MNKTFLKTVKRSYTYDLIINDKYYLLSRPSDNAAAFFGNIFISESKDLEYWGHHRLVTTSGWANWNNVKCGGGPIPIETDEGWLVFVHGVLYNVNSYVYNMGAIVLDKNDPSKVIYKCKNFLLTPQEDYEVNGHTPNVVFPTNVLVGPDGKLAIYYGAADCRTCLAFTTIDIIIDLKSNAVAEVVLNKLYKQTQMQIGFGGILNIALDEYRSAHTFEEINLEQYEDL